MAQAQHARRRRDDPWGVGLGESVYLLAITGRGKGRGNGRQLEMTEDTRDHRLLGEGGKDVQCALSVPGTRGHIQLKDAASSLAQCQ